MIARKTRKAVLALVLLAAVAVGVVYGAAALWKTAKSHFGSPDNCTIGSYDLDPSQAAVASTMVGAVSRYPRHLTHRARATVLVLAAALQESKLTNLTSGDRDSVGVLQQRPSQGWGAFPGEPTNPSARLQARARRLMDVGEATTEFLDHLANVRNWPKLPLAEAVQDVQISADGSAYAQHEPEAQAISDALRGTVAAGIECSFAKPTLVASPAKVASQLASQLGITSPVAVGRTVRVPGAGWQTAAWFVANADRLGIDEVAYDQRRWTRADGWHRATATKAAVVATMYQLAKSS